MEYPDYFYDITLPGFPGNKKYQKELAEAQKVFLSKIILAKRIHPDAKKICLNCFTPIFEVGGRCPNCEE
ncbi:MAG: hypothetical protein UR28_C0037G0018 [Candidatus Peregrinibacteria bacterium GW2011_GWF2_33_10]|uniref:Uncharacterized protein n=2 Tax=Candidatus Nomuraibacteriota TaxID=1752729 RepID=A0A0G0EBF1_9BACT|nr:MAG: hypothetical protein UR28_C0037G0018 [Candidatus Peregrinibacteria bacterium GW2011_GWF2_33_10]KKP75585.1 MAG: hypothetical protein UR72_C0004G0043 [Parcubacteria group bacterium GW2011_GWC1_35_21]KKP78352.1 MAG: hypothetical protein UR77_C0004G0067 [Candidatus Nomurabacteria bacterium GW2011_GWC2_35_35]KKP88660.1 MAG: hypothetical protein UR92_C0001G0039 [Candidatus Nomurabacteria bacterium GW2011_GWA2_35_80]KKP98426.1 MAG: hypothetical protein US05_C0004G0057 [Candidatus Nomurabacteri